MLIKKTCMIGKNLDMFGRTGGTKESACVRSRRDCGEELLAFYDYPAEHWVHLRTTNPIESTFATSGGGRRSPRAVHRTRSVTA